MYEATISQAADLSAGHPGSLGFLTGVIDQYAKEFPELARKIFSLTAFELQGRELFIVYKIICREDRDLTLALAEKCQAGIVDKKLIQEATTQFDRPRPLAAILEKIYVQMPELRPN